MSVKRTRVISEGKGFRHIVSCNRLWEEEPSEWRAELESRGAETVSVTKRIHEGRGVLVVEFVKPVTLSEAIMLLEAPEDEGEDSMSKAKGPAEVPVPDENEEEEPEPEAVNEFEGPKKGHIYQLTKDLIARVKGGASADPVKLEGGTNLKFSGEDGGKSFIFSVMNGEDSGKMVVWSRKEWDSYEMFFVDKGDSLDAPELNTQDVADTSDMGAPKKKDKEKDDSRVGAGMDAFMRVARSFPDFPARKSLETYLTRAGQELYNKPPPEPGEGGGGGGGGFGGF